MPKQRILRACRIPEHPALTAQAPPLRIALCVPRAMRNAVVVPTFVFQGVHREAIVTQRPLT